MFTSNMHDVEHIAQLIVKMLFKFLQNLLIGTLSEPPWFSASSQLPKTGIHFCLTVDTGYSGNIEHLIATYKMRQLILNCY